VRLWRASGEPLQFIEHPGCVWAVGFTGGAAAEPDLVSGCADAAARVWTTAPARQVRGRGRGGWLSRSRPRAAAAVTAARARLGGGPGGNPLCSAPRPPSPSPPQDAEAAKALAGRLEELKAAKAAAAAEGGAGGGAGAAAAEAALPPGLKVRGRAAAGCALAPGPLPPRTPHHPFRPPIPTPPPQVDDALVLTAPGAKDGETKVVREADGSVWAYGWDATKREWDRIGEVVAAPEAGARGSGAGVGARGPGGESATAGASVPLPAAACGANAPPAPTAPKPPTPPSPHPTRPLPSTRRQHLGRRRQDARRAVVGLRV
jgi:hypothetical protein